MTSRSCYAQILSLWWEERKERPEMVVTRTQYKSSQPMRESVTQFTFVQGDTRFIATLIRLCVSDRNESSRPSPLFGFFAWQPISSICFALLPRENHVEIRRNIRVHIVASVTRIKIIISKIIHSHVTVGSIVSVVVVVGGCCVYAASDIWNGSWTALRYVK